MGVAAVVVAAGEGRRFGSPKQFADLDGATVARRSVEACRAVAEFVVLVVPAGYGGDGEGADLVCEGGATRSASVRAGLAHVGEAEVVVVHDAARPWAAPVLFDGVVAAVREGADGAVPGLEVTDTLKRVGPGEGARVVEGTVARESLVAVQTPQAFRTRVLVAAHADGGEASDDAALVEAAGGRVVVVPGDPANRKITRPEDLRAAGVRA